MVSAIQNNLHHVLEKIADAVRKSGRNDEDVRLVAVTKTYPVEDILEAVRCGVVSVGENRVQELAEKRSLWSGPPIEWRLIGHLQGNKVRKALECASTVDSLDSLSLARSLARIAEEKKICLPVLIEVNTSGEESKHGAAPSEAALLLESVMKECPVLHVEGLMTVGPLTDDEAEVRRAFALLRKIRDSLSEAFGLRLKELSMGMSGDYEWAVQEGSTMVRIGSAIFGKRT
ncbi:MAG: YggS family pyridoxal phosphate-dependent enzyme [Verrucomicrobiae bacterium]|nr:YggS family pyridoxal phosphate-dependent enzyme [Verrucomicrobiae bacterium]